MTRSARLVQPARSTLLALTLIVAGAGLSGCSSDTDGSEGPAAKGPVTVLAAASLTEVFAGIANSVDDEHDVASTFSFGSSTALAEQAGEGAPGDVLATADTTSMDLAVSNGGVTADPVAFATNRLVLITPADDPGKITSLKDLQGSDWVRCADDVPCGRLTQSVLAESAFTDQPVSLEVDVKGVLTKVVEGEADAGFVYATDAKAAGDAVRIVEVPGSEQYLNTYWVAPMADGNQEWAALWVEALTDEAGRETLTSAGFELP